MQLLVTRYSFDVESLLQCDSSPQKILIWSPQFLHRKPLSCDLEVAAQARKIQSGAIIMKKIRMALGGLIMSVLLLGACSSAATTSPAATIASPAATEQVITTQVAASPLATPVTTDAAATATTTEAAV
jgi:hypothetical protein